MDWKQLEKLKKFAIQALVSDDQLLEILVLKGATAIDLLHDIAQRASIDLDFSIANDFDETILSGFSERIERLLVSRFGEQGYRVYDIHFAKRPSNIADGLADFWGGYSIEFKIIEKEKYEKMLADIDSMRKQSIVVGKANSTVFRIEISKFEHCEPKEPKDLDGYTVYVYRPILIVIEKLRAICQQMAEYKQVVPTHRPVARARDFFDIYTLVNHFTIDLSKPAGVELLRAVFEAKRVPLDLLKLLDRYREFHRDDFAAVRDTVKPGVTLREFDFYFDFVISICPKL